MNKAQTAVIEDGGDTFHFAGLDRETYIEVGRPVDADEFEALAAAMAGNGRTVPMRITRAFLRSRGASFTDNN